MSEDQTIGYYFEMRYEGGEWLPRMEFLHPEEFLKDDIECRNVTPLVEADEE